MRTLAASFVPLLLVTAASATSVTYNGFTASDVYDPISNPSGTLKLNGSSQVLPVGSSGDTNVLRLTPATTGQGGSAFSQTQVNVAAGSGFSTTFQFRFTSPGGIAPADGIVFVAQTVSSSLGAAGGGLGYQGVGHSIGVEFDSFNNGYGDNNNDSHMAIDLNGDINANSGSNGPFYSFGSNKLYNGNVWTAWIDYDATSQLLTASANQTGIRPATPQLSLLIDLSSATYLNQSTAFVGFTGATGSGFENQDVLNWNYYDYYNPIPSSVPLPPAAWAGMATLAGLCGGKLFKRRKTAS